MIPLWCPNCVNLGGVTFIGLRCTILQERYVKKLCNGTLHMARLVARCARSLSFRNGVLILRICLALLSLALTYSLAKTIDAVMAVPWHMNLARLVARCARSVDFHSGVQINKEVYPLRNLDDGRLHTVAARPIPRRGVAQPYVRRGSLFFLDERSACGIILEL